MFMRLFCWAFAGVLMAGPVLAQDTTATPPSSAGNDSSAAQNAKPADLPVSLDNIRAGLKRQAGDSLLKRPELPADFRIQILEQQKIDDLLSKLDFKSGQGPAPAGGLYGYEQQQRLFNPVDHPLVQPYAAFSGGELITIAIENLLRRYLGDRIVGAVSNAQRTHAEQAARDEVERSIAEYCAARPDRSDIRLCQAPDAR